MSDVVTDERPAGAVFSACRTYRYALWRSWGDKHPRIESPSGIDLRGKQFAAFIGLNPSTADERTNDPTIRRCIQFASAWGYSGMFMLNMFGLRSTDPSAIKTHQEPVGVGNTVWVMSVLGKVKFVVCAWGSNATKLDWRVWFERSLASADCEFVCFGVNADGAPKHPLYVPALRVPVPYAPRTWTDQEDGRQ